MARRRELDIFMCRETPHTSRSDQYKIFFESKIILTQTKFVMSQRQISDALYIFRTDHKYDQPTPPALVP